MKEIVDESQTGWSRRGRCGEVFFVRVNHGGRTGVELMERHHHREQVEANGRCRCTGS
jgi:hypothetical protein